MKELKNKKFDLHEELKEKPFYVLLHFFTDADKPLSRKELKIIRAIADFNLTEDPNYQLVIDAVNKLLDNRFNLWLELCDKPGYQLLAFLEMAEKPISSKTLKVLYDIAKFKSETDKSYEYVLKEIELHRKTISES